MVAPFVRRHSARSVATLSGGEKCCGAGVLAGLWLPSEVAVGTLSHTMSMATQLASLNSAHPADSQAGLLAGGWRPRQGAPLTGAHGLPVNLRLTCSVGSVYSKEVTK